MNLVLLLVKDTLEYQVYRLTQSHSIIGKFVYVRTEFIVSYLSVGVILHPVTSVF